MRKSEYKPRYHTGTLPIHNTCWAVMVARRNRLVKIGEVKVSGKKVGHEMDVHRSIKGYEPRDIAEDIASKRFPRETFSLRQIGCRRKRRRR